MVLAAYLYISNWNKVFCFQTFY